MRISPAMPFLTTRHMTLVLAITVISMPLSAQSMAMNGSQTQASTVLPTTQSPLRFEVISVRTHKSAGNESSDRRVLPGGRFVATATTARTLMRIAFGTDDNRMSGVPNWADNEIYDIDAITVDHTEITTPQQFQQCILSLLEDRFQLKYHREQKEGPIYWLELDKPGKNGPALKPSTADSKPNMSTNSNGSRTTMKATKMSMVDTAAALRRQAGRPVEDHTNLKGDFDFEIEWAPEETQDSNDPSLFTVLKEQLGLTLKPAKGTIEVIVIDQIAHPSEN
jgi:uncharacterized protein (TIGR03435 family)